MWQDLFVYKGKIYHTGAVFKVKVYEYPRGIYETEATFIACNPEYNHIDFKVGTKGYSKLLSRIDTWVISPTDKIDESVSCPIKKKNELAINGMQDAWIWYIVLMAFATILQGNIYYWCLISWIFFSWRNEKIKKEGYYYEW